jgi:hypothetical protein
MKPGESVISPNQVRVTSGYFEAMGARLVRGRFFDQRDVAGGPQHTIIVDEKLAARFWPNQDPIGRRMYTPLDINNLLAVSDKTVYLYVVGVIGDIKLNTLTEGKQAVGAYYYPMEQDASSGVTFAVKAKGDPAALTSSVRGILAQLDRELPVYDIETIVDTLVTEAEKKTYRNDPVIVTLKALKAAGRLAPTPSAVGNRKGRRTD